MNLTKEQFIKRYVCDAFQVHVDKSDIDRETVNKIENFIRLSNKFLRIQGLMRPDYMKNPMDLAEEIRLAMINRFNYEQENRQEYA